MPGHRGGPVPLEQREGVMDDERRGDQRGSSPRGPRGGGVRRASQPPSAASEANATAGRRRSGRRRARSSRTAFAAERPPIRRRSTSPASSAPASAPPRIPASSQASPAAREGSAVAPPSGFIPPRCRTGWRYGRAPRAPSRACAGSIEARIAGQQRLRFPAREGGQLRELREPRGAERRAGSPSPSPVCAVPHSSPKPRSARSASARR